MRNQKQILPDIYRRLSFLFFGLSALTLLLTFYLLWTQTTIILRPNLEKISQEFVFTIKENQTLPVLPNELMVAGRIRSVAVSGSQDFTPTGVQDTQSDIVGEVTIINNYSQDQTLVATTRLSLPQDPQKVIVRLKKTVTVPAGQKIKVQVYPDSPADFKDLAPSRFIIPGLWSGLQDKIYAQNVETLKLGGQTISLVTENDLNQAAKQLQDQLYQKALTQVNQQLGQKEIFWPKLISAKIEELKYSAQAGEETAEFTATMKLEAVIVVFDESQLISLLRNKLKSVLTGEKQLVALNTKGFSYEVQQYDLAAREATAVVKLEVSSILASAANLADKNKLTGLTVEEVKNYFSQFPEIKDIEIRFRPAWLKKTPRLADKIKIEIAN